MPRPYPLVVALAAAALWVAGCGAPPEWDQPGAAAPRPLPTATAGPTASVAPTTAVPVSRSPSPTVRFAETTAVACDGHPASAEIIAILRTDGLLTRQAAATVTRGPLCAGTWQYTVISVADRDPLQVVTSGMPGALTMVTAGTDVCTAEVRITAPPGIRAAAACVG